MPPDHVELNVTDCPEFIVGFDGEIDGTDKAGLTVTTSFAESWVTEVLAESVTPMQ